MKAKLRGYEAVGSGLARSGVIRIEMALGELNSEIKEAVEKEQLQTAATEALPFAEEAIGRACLFSELGERTACLIREDQIYQMLPVMEKVRKLIAPMLIIAIGAEYYEYLDKVSLCGMTCWMAGCPEEIFMMIQDAVKYSLITGYPTLLYIPARILNSSQYFDVHRKIQIGNVLSGSWKGEQRIRGKYNKYITDGEYAIVTGRELTGMVREQLYGYGNVAVVQLELIRDDTGSRLLRRYKKVLLIGKTRSVIKLYKADKKVRELMLGNNFLEWENEIKTAVQDFIDSCPDVKRHETVVYEDDSAETYVKIRKPVTEYEAGVMCPGCPYRNRIIEILTDSDDCLYCEDIFCMKRMTTVRSGIKSGTNRITEHVMGADVVFSNRPDAKYSGRSRVFMFDEKCERNGSIVENYKSQYCRIAMNDCDGCMNCRTISGCPAIWSRGIKVYIDGTRCNGCGLCRDICRKGAVVYEKR
ncbi:MAG: hypothetical protein Q4E54_00240 [Lachnospiraceae bacterium]|nr:hypothetical protein [Lachnospiraceae bacterium]